MKIKRGPHKKFARGDIITKHAIAVYLLIGKCQIIEMAEMVMEKIRGAF